MVTFKEFKEMLKHCAPDAVITEKEHHNWITLGELSYKSFPNWGHGGDKNEVENGHIRKVVRFLKISKDCAKQYLGSVFN
jgi:hypothetical protein